MRVVAVGLACAIAAAPAVPAAADSSSGPPLIGQAIRDAAAVGHPLVIELHATWCRPCKWFVKHVLPRAEVVRALARVDFVRYDVDTPEGEAVVKRYRTTSVPTFLVIDANGAAVARANGLRGDGDDAEQAVTAWFVKFVDDAEQRTTELAVIDAALAADPRDTAALLRRARYYRTAERRPEAVAAYRAVVDATPPLTGSDVAVAAAELDEVVAAETRIEDAVDAAMAFARTYPESGLATERLALAAVSGRIAADDLKPVLREHIDRLAAGADRADAIRLALALRMRNLAEGALRLWEHDLPDALYPALIRIELAILDGQYEDAARALAPLCGDPPAGIELDCYVLRRALVETWRGAPGIRRLLATATDTLAGLDRPGEGGGDHHQLEDLAGRDPVLGNAMAQSLRVATEACADRADRPGKALVAFILDGSAGVPSDVRVVAREVTAAAQRCIEDIVAARELPAALFAIDHVYAELDVAPPATGGGIGDGGTPATHGVLFDAFTRAGDQSVVGIGMAGVIGLGRVADFRAIGRVEVEAGFEDGGGSVGAGRAFYGLAIGSPRWQVSAAVGVGASRWGDDRPTALELPFDLRIDGSAGSHHVHVWARGAYLFGSRARAPEAGSALFGADETELGAAIGLRLRDRTGFGNVLYVGAAFDRYAAGDQVVLTVGLPSGTLF